MSASRCRSAAPGGAPAGGAGPAARHRHHHRRRVRGRQGREAGGACARPGRGARRVRRRDGAQGGVRPPGRAGLHHRRQGLHLAGGARAAGGLGLAAPRPDRARAQATLARPRGPGGPARGRRQRRHRGAAKGREGRRGAARGHRAQRLATGAPVKVVAEGLPQAQPGLTPKATDALRLQRGSVIRVIAQPKGAWAITQWPEAQGALVAMDPDSGRVRALVGGFDFSRQPFNHATQAWRQPGSSFKPLLYSAALEHGVMPATLVNDAPLTIGDWSPQNADGAFDGPLTLRRALAKSKNLVSVRLLQHVGVGDARAWAGRFGLDPDKQPDNLTLALGAGSVTPLQMASAYSVLANGGFKVTPRVIEKIVDAKGQVLYEAPPPAALTEPAAPDTPAPADAAASGAAAAASGA